MIVAPRDKYLISCDLSQAESWVVAFLANEPRMKKALMFGDIHTETSGAIFFPNEVERHEWKLIPDKEKEFLCPHCSNIVTEVMRYTGKRCNHANSYQMQAPRFVEVYNKESDKPPYATITLSEAVVYRDLWLAYYNLEAWWDSIEQKIRKDRTLTTPYGRTRTFFGRISSDVKDREIFKEATAFAPQSTVADHFNGMVQRELGIKGGLLEIYRQMVVPSQGAIRITNQSHDSCILEVPKSDYRNCIEQVMDLLYRPVIINGQEVRIPVDGEYGERWGELEKYKRAA